MSDLGRTRTNLTMMGIAGVALLLGIAASVLGFIAMSASKGRVDTAMVDDRFVDLRLLSTELDELDGRLESFAERARKLEAISAAAPDTTDDRYLDVLAQRVGELEVSFAETRKALVDRMSAPSTAGEDSPALSHTGHMEGDRIRNQKYVKALLDPTRSGDSRVRALRALRSAGALEEQEEVISGVLTWLDSENDPTVRADIVRNASGVGTRDMVQALVRLSTEDSAVEVRREAVEGLGKHLDQPGVRQELQRVRDSDSDAGVRMQAKAALQGLEYEPEKQAVRRGDEDR